MTYLFSFRTVRNFIIALCVVYIVSVVAWQLCTPDACFDRFRGWHGRRTCPYEITVSCVSVSVIVYLLYFNMLEICCIWSPTMEPCTLHCGLIHFLLALSLFQMPNFAGCACVCGYMQNLVTFHDLKLETVGRMCRLGVILPLQGLEVIPPSESHCTEPRQ